MIHISVKISVIVSIKQSAIALICLSSLTRCVNLIMVLRLCYTGEFAELVNKPNASAAELINVSNLETIIYKQFRNSLADKAPYVIYI